VPPALARAPPAPRGPRAARHGRSQPPCPPRDMGLCLSQPGDLRAAAGGAAPPRADSGPGLPLAGSPLPAPPRQARAAAPPPPPPPPPRASPFAAAQEQAAAPPPPRSPPGGAASPDAGAAARQCVHWGGVQLPSESPERAKNGMVRSVSLKRISSSARLDLELQLLGQVRALGGGGVAWVQQPRPRLPGRRRPSPPSCPPPYPRPLPPFTQPPGVQPPAEAGHGERASAAGPAGGCRGAGGGARRRPSRVRRLGWFLNEQGNTGFWG
jgi:hypothetical protein